MGWFRGRRANGPHDGNPLFLAYFALPLLVVGIWLGVNSTVSLVEVSQMRRWKEVPATILETTVESYVGSEGSNDCTVTATYAYEWEGRNYKGNRIGTQPGSDSTGSTRRDTHRRLDSCRVSGGKVPCYVNPLNPAQAVLFRDGDWGTPAFFCVMALVFVSGGVGIVAWAVLLRRRKMQETILRDAHPGAPWLWKLEWTGNSIRSSNRERTLAFTVFTAIYNLIAIPMAAVVVANWPHGRMAWPTASVTLLFSAIGVGLACATAAHWARVLRFGESVFKMTPLPGAIGGKVSGVVQLPVHIRPEDGFLVTLRCQRMHSGSDMDTWTTLWEAQHRVAHELLERDPARSAIPVLFTVPSSCRPTDDTKGISWELEVKARTDRGKYQSKFEIPVFWTAESSEDALANESAGVSGAAAGASY